jgi:hypothetical protein
MKFILLSALAFCLFVSVGAAQTTRTFRSQEIVLDNGGGNTDTVKFTGNVNQMLDVSGLATANGNLTLNTNLDMNNKNLLNGGSGTFTDVTATDTISITSGVLQVNGTTCIDNSGNGSFVNLTTTGAISAHVTPMFFPFYTVVSTDYMIVNESFFPFPTLNLPSSSSNPGRILVIENPNFPPFPISIAPALGDNINFTGVNTVYNLNSGSAVTLMSDGSGNWIKTN